MTNEKDSTMLRARSVSAFAVGILVACGVPPSDQSGEAAQSRKVIAGRAPVDAGELYYEMAGSGEAVVLIHGNAGDLRHWDAQFEALARQHRVVRYDVRGFGRSSDPVEGEMYSHHGDLAAFLTYLEIPRAHVVGWSMGSGIAIDFGLAHSERTLSLISVGPWVAGYSSAAAREMFSDMRVVRRAAQEGGSAAAVDAWMTAPFFAATIRDPSAGDRFRYIASGQSFLPSHRPNPREPLRPSAAARTTEIDVPMLIITAEHDIPACVEVANLLEQTVSGARRVTMSGTGHLMHIERPDEFNGIVLEFLESVGAATRS